MKSFSLVTLGVIAFGAFSLSGCSSCAPAPKVTCEPGSRMVDNACVSVTCEPGSRMVDNACVSVTCEPGSRMVDNACVSTNAVKKK